ncbi:autotransporter outer membrane beta-barrel domain-containing protein [Citrobacter sp. NCU1]|uniref:autotransporter outer membrane beta-barrel domain-containing protein n=1 Tax=Citrobacter sp. NCU1 TaxID=2026683 RepID=UPI00139148B7|nr:autotransporter outer membrane beta-barrel domain-containing protein [Citrobacter sp. NCU1]
MGYGKNDIGTLTVDGGTWFDSVTTENVPSGNGNTAVGGGGNGTLEIKNGGKAYTKFINIGQNENSTGVVTVDGADSELFATAENSSGITVGTRGSATLNITDGGNVTSNSVSYVADSAGTRGVVNVSGEGSRFTITDGQLNVGRHGDGILNITDGGTVNSLGGGIATESGATGTATIKGAESTWDIGTNRILSIGFTPKQGMASSTGSLVLEDHGKMVAGGGVNVNNDSSMLVIGAKPDSVAAAPGILEAPAVRLHAAGSQLVFNHTDTSGNYLFSPVVSGLGSLTNLSGTTVLTGANTYAGGTTISGGTLQLGNGTTAGSLTGNVLNNSEFVINNPGETSLSGVVSGTGSLTQQGTGETVLNAVNTYTGKTTLNNGTLRTDVVDSIASSNEVNINGGVFDLNVNNQQVNRLGGTGGEVRLEGATLTVNNATTIDNTTFAGDIVDGASAGNLSKTGDGSLTLSGHTLWTGDTHIDGGELVLDGSNSGAQLVSNIIGQDNTALSLRNGATLTGWIDPTDINIDKNSTWNMTADSRVDEMNLAGTVQFVAPSSLPMGSGRTLTANNWNGQNGTVVLNTVLGDDASVTDNIVVNGNTSGNTYLKVINAGGHGAYTLNGIRVVEVKGESDGVFTKYERIVGGIHEYSLEKKGADWYLTNQYATPPTPPKKPDTPEEPTNPDTSDKDKKPGTPDKPVAPKTPDAPGIPVVRPESASYTANLMAANTLFNTRLHDRLGEPQYTDALTGEKKVTSMWLRQVGGHNRFKDSSGQISTQSNRYVVQLGGDIAQWSPDALQRWHLGVMAGYGRNSSNSHSNITGYRSEGTVSGYSAGLYATWYQNDETRQGMYLDSWAQYGWFDNDVKGQDIQNESYKSRGLTASLEAGYTHKLGEFTGSQGSLNEWYIQPQAQVIWMGVSADDHRESNGTRVSGEGENNVQTRLGMRTFLKGHSKIDDGKNRTFQPFVEANWIHNSETFGVRMDGMRASQDGSQDVGELKTGVEGQLNPHLNLWGNVGVQIGDKGYSDTSAMIGVKYSF